MRGGLVGCVVLGGGGGGGEAEVELVQALDDARDERARALLDLPRVLLAELGRRAQQHQRVHVQRVRVAALGPVEQALDQRLLNEMAVPSEY